MFYYDINGMYICVYLIKPVSQRLDHFHINEFSELPQDSDKRKILIRTKDVLLSVSVKLAHLLSK